MNLNNAPQQVTAWTHSGELLTGVLNPMPLVPNTNDTINSLPAAPGAGNTGVRHTMGLTMQSITCQMGENGCIF